MCIRDRLVAYVKTNKTIKGFEGGSSIDNKTLLALDVDVLAPCALDSVITEDNVDEIRADIIVEGANGPTTINAGKILYEKGKIVAPDILANGGGVVVSYFEWVQDISWLFWQEGEVRQKLKTIMHRSFDAVWDFSKEKDVNKRDSAMAVSLKRLERSMKLRGQAW